jgi:hypothetical protein
MNFNRYAVSAASLSFALCGIAQAPITLVSPGNVPVNGTSFLVQRGTYMAPPAGGADVLFNFSALSPTTSAIYQWQNPSAVPNSAQFPDAQFVLTNAGPDTVFYKESGGLERIGDTQTITALGTSYHFTTLFSNGILELPLPFTYGAVPWTDLFQGTFTLDGATNTRNGAISGEADAWGRVVMPGGADTVEVLRVSTRLTESIPMTISQIPVSVAHVHNVSAYYPLWGKFPVLRMVSDTLSTTSPVPMTIPYAYTEWLDSSAVGVPDHVADMPGMYVFPNPAKENATILVRNPAGLPVNLDIYDMRGALVLHERFTGKAKVVDVKQWEPGMYQVVLTDHSGLQSASRLIVDH